MNLPVDHLDRRNEGGGGFAGDVPIVLLPVRIETRFVQGDKAQLLVRIYPDEIWANMHAPALTPNELTDGRAYWEKAADPAQRSEAWRALTATRPSQRAAWIVRQTAPNVEPPVDEGDGQGDGARADLLPDVWLVVGYRGNSEILRATSGPVRRPLQLTPRLRQGDPAQPLVDVSGTGELTIEEDVAWTLDFQRALAAGMALRIDLDANQRAGFDRLLVAGVLGGLTAEEGGAALAELFDAHHYTRGLALVPQGTPTNNTPAAPSPFPPDDTGGARSLASEQGASLAVPDGDGAALAKTLGIPLETFAHVEGANRHEQRAARAMANALWPCTLGYFLEQIMSPLVDRTAVQDARAWYLEHVRGRGPAPAFRVGSTPYAVLPVTSLAGWRSSARWPGEARIAATLTLLRPFFLRGAAGVPRIGKTGDPDADLLAVLGMDASAREVRIRSVTGEDTQRSVFGWFGWELPRSWTDHRVAVAEYLLAAVGVDAPEPRLLSLFFSDGAPLFHRPFVQRGALSETAGLAFDYIQWIRATGPLDLKRKRAQPREEPEALLYHMLRHAAAVEYARIAFDVHVAFELAQPADAREAELVGIVPGSEKRLTVWNRLEQPVAGLTNGRPLAEYLVSAAARAERPGRVEHAQVDGYQSSLAALEGLPTAELDRLFSETLDTCSHRIDAWITGLATSRLNDLRRAHPLGSYIGAYAWVEDLKPAPARRRARLRLPAGEMEGQYGNGGFIHAPTMNHAATAAVLRNAYLSRSGDGRAPYALDLSSRRVRLARSLLDGVREGQKLGALLGYRVERGLHEGHPGFELDRYKEPLRDAFPLAGQSTPDEGSESEEAVAARNVVDGLALWTAWKDGTLDLGPDGIDVAAGDRPAVEAELRALDDAVDAVADLLTAESVHQLVVGSTAGASASLDMLASGKTRPPDPAVANQPRGGTSVVHRFAVVLGGAPVQSPWADLSTPRADLEPHLDHWIGRLLGAPEQVLCSVSWQGGTRDVSLADLGVRPLDVVALARAAQATAAQGDVDARVAYAARSTAGDDAELTISYARQGSWPAAARTFPEALELARAAGDLVSAARPLRAPDLTPPDAPAPAADPALVTETMTRATGARDTLDTDLNALDSAATAIANGGTNLAALRAALLRASLYGVPGAVPATRTAATPEARTALLAQASAAHVALVARQGRAAAAGLAPEAIVAEVLGGDAPFLPRFAPPAPSDLAAALSGGAGLATSRDLSRWLTQAARVRAPLGGWRKLSLLARALGAAAPGYELAQLPVVAGERWIGATFGAGERPISGRVACVLHRAASPPPAEPWIGLLVDEMSEVIPSATETTGLAFHYDDPGAEAPQAILVAVPPAPAERWQADRLLAILNETLDLTRVRAVDLELMGDLGQLIPGVFLSENVKDETVSTSFVGMLALAPAIAQRSS